MTAALSFTNINVTFTGKSGGVGYTAVRDTTLNIAAGEFVSIVGPTGCGKSTLLNIGAGLLKTRTARCEYSVSHWLAST